MSHELRPLVDMSWLFAANPAKVPEDREGLVESGVGLKR